MHHLHTHTHTHTNTQTHTLINTNTQATNNHNNNNNNYLHPLTTTTHSFLHQPAWHAADFLLQVSRQQTSAHTAAVNVCQTMPISQHHLTITKQEQEEQTLRQLLSSARLQNSCYSCLLDTHTILVLFNVCSNHAPLN